MENVALNDSELSIFPELSAENPLRILKLKYPSFSLWLEFLYLLYLKTSVNFKINESDSTLLRIKRKY